MRIAIITQYYPPEPAGRIPRAFARHLAERGHDVIVLTGTPNYPTGKRHAGYPRLTPLHRVGDRGEVILRLPIYAYHGPSPLRRVANYLSFAVSCLVFGSRWIRSCDALYVYGSPVTAGIAPALHRALGTGPDFLIHAQDLWPESVVETDLPDRVSISRMTSLGAGAIARWVYSSAARLIAISPGAACNLANREYLNRHLVHTILNWADEARGDFIVENRNMASPFSVMYAGNIGHAQGLDALIEAVGYLVEHGYDLRLILVGQGSALSELRSLAYECAPTAVTFLPPESSSGMTARYSEADLHVVSLRNSPLFRYTVPGKLQQLMSHGLPILCIADGDAAGIVRRAGAGWTAMPGDRDSITHALVMAMADDALPSYGAKGRAYYQRHMAQSRAMDQLTTLLTDIA